MVTNNNELTIDELFVKATKFHQNNNLEAAEQLYKIILNKDSSFISAQNNLGLIYKNKGENEKAKICFKKVIEIDSEIAEAQNNLGLTFQKSGENEKAIDCFKKSIKINPNYSSAYYNIASTFHKVGKLEIAKNYYEKAIEIKPNYTEAYNNLGIIFNQLEDNEKAILYCKKAIDINFSFFNAHYNLGLIFQKIEENEKAINCYENAIKINPNFFNAYNNLGILFKKLGESQKAKSCYENAIRINPKFSDAYNNLGVYFTDLGKTEDAIYNYAEAFIHNPKNKDAQLNLINDLTFYSTNKSNNISNPIIDANNALREANQEFTFENLLDDNYLAIFFENSNKAFSSVKHILDGLKFNETQTFRRNPTHFNCKRHHRLFNEYNMIPKFCFSCFKIQIDPKNILELFKLFFIFDGIEFIDNNWRKCMIETRPEISGAYKGYIYCSSMKEANKILQFILPTLNKFLKCKINIKRGCSEFYKSFPNYKLIDENETNFMKYNNEWENIEKEDDSKIQNVEKIYKKTINGLSLSDFLIMRNWLSYAKIIDDSSYKNITEDIPNSELVTSLVSDQLDFRKKQLLC
jgi:tetratricopeptide (TPR) repeat protein